MKEHDVRLTVLWADDQENFVRTTLPLFQDLFTRCQWVGDGIDTLKLLARQTFDLILLDLKMPPGEWGGLKVLEEAQATVVTTPVIVLSGAGTLRQCVEAVRLGALDYVEKEHALTELRPVVDRVLTDWAAKSSLSDYGRIRDLERSLHGIVLDALRREANARHHREVFQSMVPKDVAIKSYERLLDSGCGTQEEYLDLLDLGRIIDSNWNSITAFKLLERYVGSRRDERLRWLQSLNELRKIIAHPVRGELDAEGRRELQRLEELVTRWERTILAERQRAGSGRQD